MPTVELRFGALPEHVRTARLVAGAAARRGGVGEALVDEVKLAVGEACARAVVLHRRDAPADLVAVLFSDDAGGFVVEVLDAGPAHAHLPAGLDSTGGGAASAPGAVDVATFDDEAAGLPTGLGLAVIAGLVEDVSVTPGPGGVGTTVRMVWPHAAAPAGDDLAERLAERLGGDPRSGGHRAAPVVPEQASAP